jgi:hypothetical protein
MRSLGRTPRSLFAAPLAALGNEGVHAREPLSMRPHAHAGRPSMTTESRKQGDAYVNSPDRARHRVLASTAPPNTLFVGLGDWIVTESERVNCT